MATRQRNASSGVEEKVQRGEIRPAKGKLGVMITGMGAVATTFVAGVEAVRRGLSQPVAPGRT